MTPPYDLLWNRRIRLSRDSEFDIDMIWLKEYNDVSYKQPTNSLPHILLVKYQQMLLTYNA